MFSLEQRDERAYETLLVRNAEVVDQEALRARVSVVLAELSRRVADIDREGRWQTLRVEITPAPQPAAYPGGANHYLRASVALI